MDEVKLMKRTDTKFIFPIATLHKILPKLVDKYYVLEIKGKRLNTYRSLYFDTEDFQFYHQHHNGKTNRNKVRFREYIDSGISFLEVKRKNNKGKTIKKRIKVDAIPNSLEGENKLFVDKTMGKSLTLKPQHWNKFSRITFVHKLRKERLTIDVNLRFKDVESNKNNLGEIVIAEVKQAKRNLSSDFIRLIKKERIHPFRISKYCMATAKLYPQLKINNFKRKFLHLDKVLQDAYSAQENIST
ncbi:MAG: hypothetical protein CL823_02810 [Crocinitomicaceae bacterium]|nr:hypothetical protein [Crocinitomicaceae bacterium]|tara:strand:- start:5584 stop:6312 length:729 start_codon:yes stop_codon:yes gene_type:complete